MSDGGKGDFKRGWDGRTGRVGREGKEKLEGREGNVRRDGEGWDTGCRVRSERD